MNREILEQIEVVLGTYGPLGHITLSYCLVLSSSVTVSFDFLTSCVIKFI